MGTHVPEALPLAREWRGRARVLAHVAAGRARVAARRLVVPLLVGLPPLLWVREAMRHASLESLGRDQGIFQYIAWAVRSGARDYRDIRDVNGPLAHLIHLVFLSLGGADEHRFRVLDLTVTSASFAVVGFCLPGLSFRGSASGASRRAPGPLLRLGWAFAAWVVLSAQYMHYIFWDQAQRESFFDWFMLTAVAVQLLAQSTAAPGAGPRDRRAAAWMLGASGALSVIPWFGKPTYVLFTLAQAVALLFDRDLAVPLRARVRAFALGGLAGALTQLGYLAVFADPVAFFRVYFLDVPALYRFIWPRTPLDILSLSGYSATAALSLVTSAALVGLVVEGELPARVLGVALVPVAGLVSVVVQAKGFPYHFHPVSAGLYLSWLALVVWLSERHGDPEPARPGAPGGAAPDAESRSLVRLVPMGAAAALALGVTLGVQGSAHLVNRWILQKGVLPEQRQTHDYLVYFKTADFFPWEMREAASYLREHTRPDERVQEYGMDPYLLFLAGRLSATPYIYAYDLDVDAALYGSDLPEGLHPNGEQAWRIRQMRDAHEADFLARLKEAPPAAFVFMDRSPLITEEDDAWLDFAEHNPESAAWVSERYRRTASFGDVRVWLRKDVEPGIAEVRKGEDVEGP